MRPGALRGRRGRRPRAACDGAYSSRRNLVGCNRAGVRLVSPIRVTDSGRAKGAPGWHGEASLQAGGVHSTRGFRLDRVPAGIRRVFREGWKIDVGYGIRSRVEAEFSAFKRLYDGDVMAISPDNVIHEIACKLAIHNAMLEAAGST